jgi:hypothetical protein
VKIPKCNQVWIPWDSWECVAAGMYKPASCSTNEFESNKIRYAEFLSDSDSFQQAAIRVAEQWPLSCLNFLTNEKINRIAWVGQSSACFACGLSSVFKGGFWLLTESQQEEANLIAFRHLKDWVEKHNAHVRENSTVRNYVDQQMLFGWYTG